MCDRSPHIERAGHATPQRLARDEIALSASVTHSPSDDPSIFAVVAQVHKRSTVLFRTSVDRWADRLVTPGLRGAATVGLTF
jgi:hypothetical protein